MSDTADKPKYPNDIPPAQIESLIATTAELQKQILRRYTQSVLEEMRYQLFIAQEKCKIWEQDNMALKDEIAALKNTLNSEEAQS